MLEQQNSEGLKSLRLHGMVRSLESQRLNTAIQELGFEDRLGMLIDDEKSDRDNRSFERRIKAAKFKVSACPEDINYKAHRGLDRQVISNLLTCDWVKKHLNTIITGPTGVGKTWLGCALGFQSARKGYLVLYKRLSRLLEDLEIAHGDGSLAKERAKIAKADLLILDDWALAPLTPYGRHELLELIDDRIGSGSILITSQLPIVQWHEYIGEPTVADAILDRLVHRAHRIELKGESLRKNQAPAPMAADKGGN